MSKLFKLLIPVIVLSLTSCFDITEELNVNNDGSGKYNLTIDMSGMMDMIDMMGEADSASESMDELETEYNKQAELLRAIEGITNVSSDFSKKGVYKIGYNFSSIDALNKALNTTAESKEGKESKITYSFNGKTFERSTILNQKLDKDEDEAEEETEEEESELDMDESMKSMMNMMFKDHFYTCIVHFEGSVKKLKEGEDATVSDDKKTITNKVELVDLMEKKDLLGFKAKIKK